MHLSLKAHNFFMRPVQYIVCLSTVYIAARGWVMDVLHMYLANVLLIYVGLAQARPN